MHYAIQVEILRALHNLLQQIDGLLLGQFPPLLQKVEHIIVAELSDDIHVVGGLVDVVELHDIAVLHLLHDLDLGVQVLEVEAAREEALVDHLHRHWLPALDHLPPVDRGVGTLTQQLLQVELVFLDPLLGLHLNGLYITITAST